MKCSLKDGFIYILFIVFIAPSEGIEFPLFIHRSSVLDKPMNLQQFRASINRLQDLDSFPGICENRLHRIVKKQMTGSDFKDGRRNKRAVVSSPQIPIRLGREGAGDGAGFANKDNEKAEEPVNNSAAFLKARIEGESTATESFLKRLKEFAREKESIFLRGPKKTAPPSTGRKCGGEEDQIQPVMEKNNKLVKGTNEPKTMMDDKESQTKQENSYLSTEIRRVPDQSDYRYYYECEVHSNGCLKLRHKRCPEGQFFSYKYLKCLKSNKSRLPLFRRKKSPSQPILVRKQDLPDPREDPEPSNEWLDANQGVMPRIPSEFKPKKKPDLKIYHLRVKRTQDKRHRKQVHRNYQEWSELGMARVDSAQVPENSLRRVPTIRETKRHHPRSYVIHINRKEGKGDQITDSNENENDNDEDDEEADEEDDYDESDEEDEEGEGDDQEIVQEKTPKETLRDLLRSAKEAVTNRARFEDPTQIAPRAVNQEADHSSLKSKKSDESTALEKKVLIDANIKVDGALGSIFRSFLKNRKKDFDSNNKPDENDAFVSDRESQDKLDPELLRTYENLMRNNPRVKRYFLVNCSARRN